MKSIKMFLNDEEFTQVFIDMLEDNSASDNCTFSDINNKYLYVSTGFLEFYGVTLDNVIGKRFIEVRPEVTDLTEFLQKTLEVAFKDKPFERRLVSITNDNGDIATIDLVITRVLNPYTRNYVGVVGYVNSVMASNPLKEIIRKINKRISFFTSSNELGGVVLTEREHEILVLLSLGKSYKEIAVILSDLHGRNFSPTSISNITYRKLFEKFNVVSLSGLIERGIALDIACNIPQSFV
mgnify:CR=1 FL=1